MKRLITTVVFVMLTVTSDCVFASRPSTAERQKAMQAITTLLTSKNYAINAESGFIKINRDTLHSTLPYCGSSDVCTFGNEAGLRYIGSISDYRLEVGKKNQIFVYMTVIGFNKIKYYYKIEVFYNGKAFMKVSSANIQPILYYGAIRRVKK